MLVHLAMTLSTVNALFGMPVILLKYASFGSSFPSLAICGNYCGPGWCSGRYQSERTCNASAVVLSCADRCCMHHDACCAGPDARSCNAVFLSCLAACTSTGADAETPCLDGGGHRVAAPIISGGMSLLSGDCCSGACPDDNTDTWSTRTLTLILWTWTVIQLLIMLAAVALFVHYKHTHAEVQRSKTLNVAGSYVPRRFPTGASSAPPRRLLAATEHFPQETHEMELAFNELSFDTSKKRRILNGVSGLLLPGEILAVMGPSGCGKTTFLDALADQAREGFVSGQLLLNGRPVTNHATKQSFRECRAYMMQLASPYINTLTVRENLIFAAMLKLPPSFTLQQKIARALQTASLLGIERILDVPVGGTDGGGISGGQRRLLTLGMSMLALPAILILDEPTSGLDSTSSLTVVKVLRAYADSGRSVALTIHQPRNEIFELFDSLLLLNRGSVSYCGLAARASQFFQTVEAHLNLSTEIRSSQADFLIDVLGHTGSRLMHGGETSNVKVGEYAVQLYNQEIKPVVNQIIESFKRAAATGDASFKQNFHQKMGRLSPEPRTEKSSPKGVRLKGEPALHPLDAPPEKRGTMQQFVARVATLQARQFYQVTLSGYLGNAIQQVMAALIMSLLFWDPRNTIAVISTLHKLTTLPVMVMRPAICKLFLDGMRLLTFEVEAGACSPLQFIIQMQIHIIAWQAGGSILSATILFCSAFQPPDARELMLTVALTTMCNHAYASIYFAICAGMRWRNGTAHNVAGAIQLCNLFSSMNLLFAGFFVPYKDMPTWCQWAYFISPAQYAFTAAFRAVASGVDLGPLPTDTGRYWLHNYGYENIDVSLNIVALLLFWLAFTLLTYCFLEMHALHVRPLHWLSITTTKSQHYSSSVGLTEASIIPMRMSLFFSSFVPKRCGRLTVTKSLVPAEKQQKKAKVHTRPSRRQKFV